MESQGLSFHYLNGYVVVTKMPVQHQVGQGDHPGDQGQQGFEPACNKYLGKSNLVF